MLSIDFKTELTSVYTYLLTIQRILVYSLPRIFVLLNVIFSEVLSKNLISLLFHQKHETSVDWMTTFIPD